MQFSQLADFEKVTRNNMKPSYHLELKTPMHQNTEIHTGPGGMRGAFKSISTSATKS